MSDSLTLQTLSIERLRADVAEVLGEPAESIDPTENLLDRGLDSIRLMTLVERWSRAGIRTTFLELAEDPTPAGWLALFERKAQA